MKMTMTMAVAQLLLRERRRMKRMMMEAPCPGPAFGKGRVEPLARAGSFPGPASAFASLLRLRPDPGRSASTK